MGPMKLGKYSINPIKSIRQDISIQLYESGRAWLTDILYALNSTSLYVELLYKLGTSYVFENKGKPYKYKLCDRNANNLRLASSNISELAMEFALSINSCSSKHSLYPEQDELTRNPNWKGIKRYTYHILHR